MLIPSAYLERVRAPSAPTPKAKSIVMLWSRTSAPASSVESPLPVGRLCETTAFSSAFSSSDTASYSSSELSALLFSELSELSDSASS